MFITKPCIRIVFFSLVFALDNNSFLYANSQEYFNQLINDTKKLLEEKISFDWLFKDILNQHKQLVLDLIRFVSENSQAFDNKSQEIDSFIDKSEGIFDASHKILKTNIEMLDKEKAFFGDFFNFSEHILKMCAQTEVDAHFFVPKEPRQLDEEYKKRDIKERIAAKYIGTIPNLVEDVIFYFSNYEECIQNNITIHNRILLHGRPGTGKSYLVQVLAEELELPFLSFTASFFEDKYVGESSRRIRKAFDVVKNYNKPILMFIDEIDALAPKRNKQTDVGYRATLLTLLTELQNIYANKNIFVFVATNDFEVLDIAIKDRFAGAICEIKDLSVEERARLFKKEFAEKGITIDSQLAIRLAQIIRPRLLTDPKNYKDHFTNRDIQCIVQVALLKQFAENKSKNLKKQKHLCAHIRAAIDATNKKGRFAWFKSTYCNGI